MDILLRKNPITGQFQELHRAGDPGFPEPIPDVAPSNFQLEARSAALWRVRQYENAHLGPVTGFARPRALEAIPSESAVRRAKRPVRTYRDRVPHHYENQKRFGNE
jgi:hypothetical protein